MNFSPNTAVPLSSTAAHCLDLLAHNITVLVHSHHSHQHSFRQAEVDRVGDWLVRKVEHFAAKDINLRSWWRGV